MTRLKIWLTSSVAAFLICVAVPESTPAVSLDALGVKAGVDLTRNTTMDVSTGITGGEFDGARTALGAYLDLGSVFTPRLHLVPGADLTLETGLRIFSMNLETWYFFHRKRTTGGYAGVGIGTHFYRFNAVPNDTKISLNIPVGFQKKLSGGLSWFSEMKFIIADNETDSSFRFSLGFLFGSGE